MVTNVVSSSLYYKIGHGVGSSVSKNSKVLISYYHISHSWLINKQTSKFEKM